MTEAARRRALVIDGVRWACLGGALVSAGVALLGPAELAISIVLGTLLGAINFVLLARGIGAALDRTVADVQRTRQETGKTDGQNHSEGVRPEEVVGRPRGAGGALRLSFVVLLVAGALMFPPTQPLGLAIGVIIVLAAISLAAWRQQGESGQPEAHS